MLAAPDPKIEGERLPNWRGRSLVAVAATVVLGIAGFGSVANVDSNRLVLRGGLGTDPVTALAVAAPEGIRAAPALVALPPPPASVALAPTTSVAAAVDPLAPPTDAPTSTTAASNLPSTTAVTPSTSPLASPQTTVTMSAPAIAAPAQSEPVSPQTQEPPPPATTQPPPPSPTTQPPPQPSVPAVRSFSFAGGSITAAVSNGSVQVLSVSTIRGYDSDVQSRGSSQYVRLVGGSSWEGILVSVGSDGGPTANRIAGSE